MTDFDNAKKQLEQIWADKQLLRYLITNAEIVNSTAVKDPNGCKYIYVKPGMYDEIMGVSNIDFVQEIYTQNGINLKKHISHLDDKETEVLIIPVSEYLKLNESQKKFLDDTAPSIHKTKDVGQRSTQVINLIFHRNRKSELQEER